MDNSTPGRRLSSLPAMHSPLGPGHQVNLSASNLPGLLSPSLVSPNSRSGWRKKVNPQKLDLHVLKVSANSVGSPYHKPKGFGLGHERNITDPFVEQAEDKSSKPSPFVAHVTQEAGSSPTPMDVSPGEPTLRFPASPFSQHGEACAPSLSSQGFARSSPRSEFGRQGTPRLQPFQSTTPWTPSFSAFANSSPRVDLPVPPPPLTTTEGQLFHTPEMRARLDAQAAVRADWIRTEAKKIADLSCSSFAAARRFEKTGTQEDYETWQQLAKAYEDATDLEKRQEERRNMFMPQGMQAMRTGGEIASDLQSAAFPTANGAGQGEGHLLGFQMAYMERICAEIKRSNDEKEVEKGDEITAPMLDTLSKDEKMALRKHLVARLNAAASSSR
ncbi:hypothetical protein BDU57DRAFT_530246 [Ampelomyces quisqualis]|uniref:Uncharacterized protein n=1 Tax=Ampelomyces quisqualis TaxID=50730 RepID=A0A6A5QK42_AMPQU|nr:hypothetical protein BDU57DRAFT_530246 [Ampelomyces quisqualis]